MRLLLLLLLAALAALAACSDGHKQAPPAMEGAKPAAPPAYRVEAAPPATPCDHGMPCAITLQLTALRDYHVNPDYPFKFLAEPTPGLAPEGTGEFVRQAEKSGTLTFRFRAANPGSVRISGVMRLSVCNDDECQIKETPVAVEVPVS